MKSTVSSKGQITLPAEVRRRLGLSVGTAVSFRLVEGGVLLTKGLADAHPVDKLFGRLQVGRPVDRAMAELRGKDVTTPARKAQAPSRSTRSPKRKR